MTLHVGAAPNETADFSMTLGVPMSYQEKKRKALHPMADTAEVDRREY